MGLLRWFTKNWANTTEPTHPDLQPLDLAMSIAETVARVKQIATGPWNVESSDDVAGTIHLTHRTGVFRFVDDIRLSLKEHAGGTRIHAESRSRIGKGDLGQNRRNIREIFTKMSRAQ